MSDQPSPQRPTDADLPPLTVAEMPPQLQAALKQMSKRGPVVNMTTRETVAEGGQLVGEQPAEGLMACVECARAVALGWWGSTARHFGDDGAPVCALCGEGEATLTATAWFALVVRLTIQNTASGMRRSWRDDAIKGLGAATIMPCPTCAPEDGVE
jgi:hypothetical protein